jgi:hypothetical protein
MSELLLTPQRERVHGCEVVIDGVSLELPGRRVMIDVLPDERHAARACRLANRVLSVEFRGLDGDSARARFTAVWHRMPHTQAISVAAGLALALAGVPSYVMSEDPR